MADYFLFALFLAALAAASLVYFYLKLQLAQQHISKEQLASDYIPRQQWEQLQQQADLHYANWQEALNEARNLSIELTRLRTAAELLEKQIQGQQGEMERLQAASHAHFERIAAQLFEEKGKRFTQQNADQLHHLLAPLQQRIQSFEQQIERRFVEETRDRVSLKQEIKGLMALNQQLSSEANNLADALRGDNKKQGDWGEWQLETLLKAGGLESGLHYRAQNSFTGEDGQQKRPDFIINLPDDKHLVIDSKVSLANYERFCSASQADDQAIHLRAHIRSLRQHIKDLASKKYENIYQINSPDYLLLYVPIEPAYNLALREDRKLFMEALERNIVLVNNTTLLTTLRTVSYIWKQEKQKQHVQEIAAQSGKLYDKFVSFVEDLKQVGQQIDKAQQSYQSALNRLSESSKPGDNLIARAEKLRELGAKNTKQLPKI